MAVIVVVVRPFKVVAPSTLRVVSKSPAPVTVNVPPTEPLPVTLISFVTERFSVIETLALKKVLALNVALLSKVLMAFTCKM